MLETRPSTRTEPASAESLLPTAIWLWTAMSVLIAVAYSLITISAGSRVPVAAARMAGRLPIAVTAAWVSCCASAE